MAYVANRDDDSEIDVERERANHNNAESIRKAADVASHTSANPFIKAAATGVGAADLITRGETTDFLARRLTRANEIIPGGHLAQDAINKANESGLSDAAKAAGANATDGGGQGGPPSSNDTSTKDSDSERSDDNKNSRGGIAQFIGKSAVVTALISFVPIFIIFIIFFAAIATVSGLFGDYEDAFGMSSTMNEETGGLVFSASSPEQESFYERVNQVKLEYQAKGKTVDAMKIVSAVHVLNNNGADISYDDMTTQKIEQIADSMFNGNTYSEEAFKQNMSNTIIPSYISGLSNGQKEDIVKETLDYIDRYNSLVGSEGFNPYKNCGGTYSCSYDIKGYYIHGKGNVNENIAIDNVYVRLMQCGTANGHNYGGTFGKPLEDENLVPFEKYILGVAYQEIGESAPAEAIKAQMVAARSYSLARHADMAGWRTLKKEGDKWVLQIAACTQDHVYCDPDQGCSSDDGQWKMVYSGTLKAKKLKDPLPQDSPLRTYISETAGEVLVNSSGYIIYSGYKSEEQTQMSSLANSGLNYKQILLQIYNQGSRNYKVADVKSSTCTHEGGSSCVSGAYSQWMQRGESWSDIQVGNSGSNIGQIGCLVTSVSMLVAKSGVPTNITGEFNPGTFVTYLNSHGGFASGGNFIFGSVTSAVPSWKYQGQISLSGLTKQQKLAKIKEIISQPNTYAVVEVKGNTGQHWVAIDSVSGDTVNMMDPSTNSTDMWAQYNWANTSVMATFKVS